MAKLKQRVLTVWRQWPRWLHGVVITVGVLGLIGGVYGAHSRQQAQVKSQAGLAAVTRKDSAAVNDGKDEQSASGGSVTTASGSSAVTARKPNKVWVEVKGAVVKPDVYQFTGEVRAKDLIAKAGGLTAQADDRQLNLAAKLQDGQSLYVPAQGEEVANQPPPAGAGVTAAADLASTGSQDAAGASATTAVNLNQADLTQLQQISGIGPKKAADILAYREQHGVFKTVDELTEVSGIGPKTLAGIRDQVCVN